MKHAKVQRSPKSLIALVLAIALLVSAIPFTAVAGDVDYYNATTTGLFTGNQASGTTLTSGEDASLTPTFTSQWLNWTWTTAPSNYYFVIGSANNPTTLTSNDSLMFYIKLPSDATGTKIAFRLDGTASIYTGVEKPIYFLAKDATEWTESATVLKSGTTGDVVFPNAFEGWIRIPLTSFATELTTHNPTRVRSYWNGSSTAGNATDGVTIGSVFVVDATTANYTKVSIDGADAVTLFAQKEEEPDPEPGELPLENNAAYTANMAQVVQIAGSDYDQETDGAKDVSLVTASTEGAPHIPGKFAKFTVANTGKWVRLVPRKDTYFANENMSLMLYVKSLADEETMFKLSPHSNSNPTTDGKPYYLLQNAPNAEWTKAASDVEYITLPANFEGWVRIPHSSFKTSMVGTEFQYIRLFFDADTVGATFYMGAITYVEDAKSYEFKVNGAPAVSLFPQKTIEMPAGVTAAVDTFYGFESLILQDNHRDDTMKVTVDDIASFVGCKLYYQYQNEEGETVKIALLRAGSQYHGTADAYDEGVNNTEFYIPALQGAKDAKIVADTASGTLSDNATVVGVQAVYYVDEEENISYIDAETGKFTFKVTARVAREVVDNGVAYDLKHVKLTVAKEGSASGKTYDISTLSDRCDKYAEFVKPLSGTNEQNRYDITVVGIYEAEDGAELTVTSDALTGQSIETVVANDGIIE